ncbi:hypothetical protein HQ394_17695 [Defluviicoccus vanus]|uniref:DUF2945 domain-containing protein n=1 Tax=Defluviicoccus vanus TaxID=111831 RepID=A0A7H1N524_9PROT|nr:hypothetical protein [Defluviicoccus vanus]QNT70810.1 hypothetical protein HQ394_17695 [Defluviicoccus vanus]
MKSHKFAVGQTVRYSPGSKSYSAPADSYKVVRLLPAEANDYQYRVKSSADGHERVVKESQLS